MKPLKSALARGLAVATLAVGTLAAGMALGAPEASALSILVDNGPTTYDPGTDLSWLDLTATAGVSFNDIIAGAGHFIADGWRYATVSELGQFFSDAGGPAPYSGINVSIQTAAATQLLTLMGVLYSAPGAEGTQGIVDRAGLGYHGVGSYAVFSGIGSLNDGGGFTIQADFQGFSGSGSFLVKSGAIPVAAAPIPATLPLFAAALGGLGLIGWRRKNAAA